MYKTHNENSIFLIIPWLLVCIIITSACQSNRTQATKIPGIRESVPSDTAQKKDSIIPLGPTDTPESLSMAPGIKDTAIPIPDLKKPTPTIIEQTETPVPPLVITPQPPLYPLTGIEITNINNIDLVAQSGIYWIRWNALQWPVVEPSEGARDWNAVSTLENNIKAISEHGMHTILIVRGTPSWAQKVVGSYCGPIIENKLAAFGDFMHDVVMRYSKPPFSIKYWEIGNEPDVDPSLVPTDSLFGCWGDQNDNEYGGGYYAEMLKKVYPAIKSADPEAQVLIGGLLLVCDPDNPPDISGQPGVKSECSSSKFLEGVLKNGGGDYFDGVSFHAYDYYSNVLGVYGNTGWYSSWKSTGPVLIAKALYIHKLLDKYGYTSKYLMNTELAALCGRSGTEEPCRQGNWINTKTYYLVEAYTAAAIVELRANIWYSMDGWRGSGLLNSSGQPEPAFRALTFNNQMLRGAIPMGEVTLYQGVKGFAFQRDNHLLWILWSLDGQDHGIPLGIRPGAIFSVLGEKLPSEDNITITLSPVYIEW